MDEPTPETTRPAARTSGALLRPAGAGLLLATGGIHLDLYLTGYRRIPTIGALFLLQVIAAFLLAGLVLAVARRTAALVGTGFAVSTLGGYILSLWVGLFGFDEVRTAAGAAAGAVEIAALVALAAYAAFFAPDAGRSPGALALVGRRAVAPLGALAVLALVLAFANSSGAGSSATGTHPRVVASGGSVAAGGSVRVTIKNFAFVPASFTVSPGERIVVTNDDGVAHTFTATTGSKPQGRFNSGDIAPGRTVTVVAPSAAGSYPFDCSIHPFMTGTVTVT